MNEKRRIRRKYVDVVTIVTLKVREEGSVTNHQQEIQVSNKDNVVCKESLLFL